MGTEGTFSLESTLEELDPLHRVELAMLRTEHQKKFQAMIDFLKERVGEGVEYRNSIARVVVSATGAYYELHDLPEEFSGGVGPDVETQSIAPEAAIALLTRAVEALPRIDAVNTRHCSLLVLYTRRGIIDRQNCFVYEYQNTDPATPPHPLVIGHFQPDVMPLFFKIKFDADFAKEVLDMPRGMVFCIANAGDRHLLIRLPFTGNQVANLNDLPFTNTIQ